jgi:hypothetical protein
MTSINIFLKKKNEDLKKERQPQQKNRRRPQQKNGRQPQKIKNGEPQAQFKKSTLIGCDILVN